MAWNGKRFNTYILLAIGWNLGHERTGSMVVYTQYGVDTYPLLQLSSQFVLTTIDNLSPNVTMQYSLIDISWKEFM
jgi:hypothetical protein